MPRSALRRLLVVAVLAAAGSGFAVAPVTAQVRYARPDAPVIDFFSPYDESYGTSPSFEVHTLPYGGAAVRVVERCQYPDGWNVTDFGRDLNGIPAGIDHACPSARYGGRVRARY